jgi:hypothetical protein
MKMKKIFFIAAFPVFMLQVSAQLTQTLFLNANPPASLADWYTKREIFLYVVNNAGGMSPRAVIKAEIKNASGELVAVTNLSTAPVYTFSSPSTILEAQQVLGLEYLTFRGSYAASLKRTGMLPSENYQLCLQLVTPADYRPLSEVICRNFFLASYQPPYPLMPSQDAALDATKAQQAIIFRWTPVSPKPLQPVIYEIVVTEMLPHQTPMQAFRSNQPLLKKEITGTTQYIWTPQLNLKDGCCNDASADSLHKDNPPTETATKKQNIIKKFVWGVRAKTSTGYITANSDAGSDGFAEVLLFKTVSELNLYTNENRK